MRRATDRGGTANWARATHLLLRPTTVITDISLRIIDLVSGVALALISDEGTPTGQFGAFAPRRGAQPGATEPDTRAKDDFAPSLSR